LQAGYIGAALLFTTDPGIAARHLVVLADDRGLQPAENITPLVRRSTMEQYGPRLLATLNKVSALLGTGTLRALDARVEVPGQDVGTALPGRDTDAVADRCGQRDQGGGHRLGGHRARPIDGRPDYDLSAVAASAGVHGQPVLPGDCRNVDLRRAVQTTPVRR